MSQTKKSKSPIIATQIIPRTTSNYPPPFAQKLTGRVKYVLGDIFGISNFGVNETVLEVGARSSLRHHHSLQDELIYILEGTPTLVTSSGEQLLQKGMVVGFKAGEGDGHCIINKSDQPVRFIEIGDRTAGDQVVYPDDDLAAKFIEGKWKFTHKDGSEY